MPKAQRSIRHNHSYGKCPETCKLSRLRVENEQLKKENEQFRQIFDAAVDEFNKLKRRIEQQKGELNCEKEANKDLEKRIRQLERELSNERGKANKFASMLFGLKSEKLKLSDIKVEDRNSIVVEEISESEITNAGEDESAGEKEKKTEAEKDNDTKRENPEVRMAPKEMEGKFLKGCRLWIELLGCLREKSFMEFRRRIGRNRTAWMKYHTRSEKKSNGTWNVLSGVNILLLRITPLAFSK